MHPHATDCGCCAFRQDKGLCSASYQGFALIQVPCSSFNTTAADVCCLATGSLLEGKMRLKSHGWMTWLSQSGEKRWTVLEGFGNISTRYRNKERRMCKDKKRETQRWWVPNRVLRPQHCSLDFLLDQLLLFCAIHCWELVSDRLSSTPQTPPPHTFITHGHLLVRVFNSRLIGQQYSQTPSYQWGWATRPRYLCMVHHILEVLKITAPEKLYHVSLPCSQHSLGPSHLALPCPNLVPVLGNSQLTGIVLFTNVHFLV